MASGLLSSFWQQVYFLLLGSKKKKITKRRTAGSRSEAKNREVFSKRKERTSFERAFRS